MAMGWDEDAPDAGGVEELRRQVEALWLENAVMGETIRVLKADDPRLDPGSARVFAHFGLRPSPWR